MKNILLLCLLLSGCGGGPEEVQVSGPAGQNGKDGVNGTNGADGANGSNGAAGAKGDKGDKGNTGSTGAQGNTGATGPQGNPGINGTNGADGTAIVPVKFCNEVAVYPSTFPEYGLCINGKLFAVYSANDGFLAYIPNGTYHSNAINSACNFTVTGCVVSH